MRYLEMDVIQYVIAILISVIITNQLVSLCHAENNTSAQSTNDTSDDSSKPTPEELIEELKLDSEMKHSYRGVVSIDARNEIYVGDVIDLYYAYFHELEITITKEVPDKFKYSRGYEKHPEMKIYKEGVARKFSEILDKYVDIVLKHKLFVEDVKGFSTTFSREEQVTFFHDYFYAHNYTKTIKCESDDVHVRALDPDVLPAGQNAPFIKDK